MTRGAIAFLFFLACVFLQGCDSSPSGEDSELSSRPEFSVDSLHYGFLKVSAANHSVSLGTDMDGVLPEERPQMKVKFSYDFSIGKAEVSCGEFNAVMKKAGHELQLPCGKDSLPAVNVTYYDAVLFSNALSKEEGLDSVYSYGASTFDGEGHCKELEGLIYHPDRNGIRLPTEAEWVYVAEREWNSGIGWTMENSSGVIHPVCTADSSISSTAVCDMMGNAMEWVNDWLGKFRNETVVNFVGYPDGGLVGARVVKGGSFRNEKSSLGLYRRGDIYTVTSSTRSDYVGFRVAYGAIPDATWLSSDGDSLSSPVSLLTNLLSMKKMTGSYESKLVFRNDVTGNLAYVDYSSATLRVIEFNDGLNAYHPDISPDGKWVAFCTGMEGTSMASAVYVRNLDGDDDLLVKLNVENAAIPRWRVLESGDTVIVYVSSADNNKDATVFKKSTTWQVPFGEEGEFGTPEKILDGAYHGGVSDDNKLAVTGARLLRTRLNGRDSLWYDGEQACNVSLSKDGLKQTLFLDFAGKPGIDFAGKKYGVHEMMLVADSTGKLVQMVPAPGDYSYDHSEWALWSDTPQSNRLPLAIATLTNINGTHEKIALVNLADSSLVELAEGENLWHPCLWIRNNLPAVLNPDLDLDSAGVYLTPGGAFVNQCVRVKMELLWKNFQKLEYLCVGSSRMAEGLIPDSLTAGFAVNMAHSYNDLDASVYIAENYGLNVLPNLKAIVIGLDFDLWQVTTAYSDVIFQGAPGYAYDESHDFWVDGVPEYFVEAVENSYPAASETRSVYYDTRGFAGNPSAGWGEPVVDSDISWEEKYPDFLDWNMSRLRGLIILAEKKNIPVVGVIFPQNPDYRKTESWGRYGPTRKTVQRLMETIEGWTKTYSNFYLLDENKMGDHDYSDEMALNTDHLAVSGAAQFTRRLDSLLKSLK